MTEEEPVWMSGWGAREFFAILCSCNWTIERELKRQPEIMQKEPLPGGDRLLNMSLALKSCAETQRERMYETD